MSHALRYGAGALAGVIAGVVRYALDSVWGTDHPFLTFYPAVMLATWYGGLGPGLLAVAVAAAGAWYLMSPRGILPAPAWGDVLAWIVFIGISGLIVGLTEAMHRQQRLAETARDAARCSAMESQAAAAATREGEERLRLAQKVARIGTFELNIETGVNQWTPELERMYGLEPGQFPGTQNAWESLVHPADRAEAVRQVQVALDKGDFAHEWRVLTPDGRVRWLAGRAFVFKDDSGRPLRLLGINIDISDRKENEERLRQLVEFNQAVMANMGEGLYTLNTEGLVTSVNPAAERLFGWTRVELLGRRMHEVTHYKRPDGSPFPIEECTGFEVLKTGAAVTNQEDVFIRRDGTFFPVVYSSSCIISDARVVGLVVVFRDVTHQKQAEAEREELLAIAQRARAQAEAAVAAEHEARKAAEAANRAKDAFLATVSHELRTPLSPILAWSRLLLGATLDDDKRRHAVEVIERCAKTQTQLIEDLLDVSRIIAGKMRLEVRPVDLAAIIEAAIEVVRPAATAKGVRLQSVLDTQAGVVSGDPERLQQVIWNLLSNAVKFTPKGGRVNVVLERVNSHIEIAVSDTGLGIAANFLPHIFERFMQADDSTTRAHGGLGLGLAIVRHIVEAHGGSIYAESPGPSQGAVFTVKLPLILISRTAGELKRRHPAAAGITHTDTLQALSGLRVLVVDDEPSSNDVVCTILTSCGAEVRVAASAAAEAREVLSRWNADVLVSDIGMPDEDGYELIAKIRSLKGTTAKLPAIALTAYTSREDRIRLLSAGFYAHVPKPLDPAELVTVIANLARTTGRLP